MPRDWAKSLPAGQPNLTDCIWLKLAEDGAVEIIADTGALLYPEFVSSRRGRKRFQR